MNLTFLELESGRVSFRTDPETDPGGIGVKGRMESGSRDLIRAESKDWLRLLYRDLTSLYGEGGFCGV